MTLFFRCAALAATGLWLSACTPVAQVPPPPPGPSPHERLAAIEAAAAVADTELDVQPLRDPQVTDLREQAARARAGGDLAGAVSSNVFTPLAILAIVAETKRPLSELARVMTRYPQLLINVPIREAAPAAPKALRSVRRSLLPVTQARA